MIRITIELVPYGIEKWKKTIGLMKIINDSTGTKEIGNYKYQIIDENGNQLYEGIYKGFPRKLRIWRLIQEIFKTIPEENIKI